nr:MAG TPA: hypothetical protein [Caudoviricetes sp.]
MLVKDVSKLISNRNNLIVFTKVKVSRGDIVE